jgi:beta-glucosidase
MSLAEWRSRHERQLAVARRGASKLVFLGDSITEAWVDTSELRKRFASYEPLNLGIGGDQTQHVLWRIEDGTLEGLAPLLVVLLIGVNNLGNGYEPSETVKGIEEVVERVLERLPRATVLLLQVLPAGQNSTDALRNAVNTTNQLLAQVAWGDRVDLLDIGGALVNEDESIAEEIMGDFLHPTEQGYAAMTKAAVPAIERLLRSQAQR